MCGDRFSSSTTCSRWRHETEPGRLDQSRSCRFWKVATHPHPAVATQRQTQPTDPVGIELGALLLDKGIDAGLVEDTIQALAKRMARAARQIRTGHPHRPLPPATTALAHCHGKKRTTPDRAYRSRSRTFTTACYRNPRLARTRRKLLRPASRFSMISSARSSGSGRLSRSVRLLSLSQKMSRLVLSRALRSP